MRYPLPEWLRLDNQDIARIVAQKVTTVAVYVNGTRRWFLSQSEEWNDYAEIAGKAQRALSQLFYDHGIQTLIQPVLGYDLLERGQDYLSLAVEQGLAELAAREYRDWYHQDEIRLTFYGNWPKALSELGFGKVVTLMNELMLETSQHTKRKLLLGVFADEGLNNIINLAQTVSRGNELVTRYYGQAVGPVDIVIGSGQPAIWDLPLLDINKASLYFLQAPTFCLNKDTLRRILYDHLYQRVNDDDLYDNLSLEDWQNLEVIGLGYRTKKGWRAT